MPGSRPHPPWWRHMPRGLWGVLRSATVRLSAGPPRRLLHRLPERSVPDVGHVVPGIAGQAQELFLQLLAGRRDPSGRVADGPRADLLPAADDQL